MAYPRNLVGVDGTQFSVVFVLLLSLHLVGTCLQRYHHNIVGTIARAPPVDTRDNVPSVLAYFLVFSICYVPLRSLLITHEWSTAYNICHRAERLFFVIRYPFLSRRTSRPVNASLRC